MNVKTTATVKIDKTVWELELSYLTHLIDGMTVTEVRGDIDRDGYTYVAGRKNKMYVEIKAVKEPKQYIHLCTISDGYKCERKIYLPPGLWYIIANAINTICEEVKFRLADAYKGLKVSFSD